MSTNSSSLSRNKIRRRCQRVLKRHEHGCDVRFTHKQLDRRADMELIDDTTAKRAKLFDTSSSIFFQVTILRRICMFHLVKSEILRRVKASRRNLKWMLIWKFSAIEALTNAKLEVDRTLDKTDNTLHRLLEEIPLECEAITKAAELNSIRDNRVHTSTRTQPTPRSSR